MNRLGSCLLPAYAGKMSDCSNATPRRRAGNAGRVAWGKDTRMLRMWRMWRRMRAREDAPGRLARGNSWRYLLRLALSEIVLLDTLSATLSILHEMELIRSAKQDGLRRFSGGLWFVFLFRSSRIGCIGRKDELRHGCVVVLESRIQSDRVGSSLSPEVVCS